MMTASKLYRVAVFIVISCVLLAGCFYLPQGDEVNITFPSDDSNETSPISVTETGIEVKGFLIAGGGPPDRDIYRDISVRLYAENGKLLCVERVGDWNLSNGTKNVSFQYTNVPHYIVIYSEDFWNEPMTVEYFEYDAKTEEFLPHEAASEDELPVEVSKNRRPLC